MSGPGNQTQHPPNELIGSSTSRWPKQVQSERSSGLCKIHWKRRLLVTLTWIWEDVGWHSCNHCATRRREHGRQWCLHQSTAEREREKSDFYVILWTQIKPYVKPDMSLSSYMVLINFFPSAYLGWVVKVWFLSETSNGQRLMDGLNYLFDMKEKRWSIYWLNAFCVNYW